MNYYIYKTALATVIMLLSLVIAMYSTYFERKVAAWFQDRRGPNRAGPFGLLQPLADGLKLLYKEEFMPNTANRSLYIMGPMVAMMVALLTSAVIPWGGTLEIGGQSFSLQVADINIGILYIMAITSVGVYGIMLGGWASNNKYSLLGAIRAASQMISYELALGLAILAVVMMSGSLSLNEIVAQQKGFHWNIIYQPVGFLVFLICAMAECNRAPFDLPECETELVGGFHTEYSSMKLGFYLFSEYINMFISSALMAALFFGGYNFPGLGRLPLSHNAITLIGSGIFLLKTGFFVFLFMWIRWTLPRFRYDQLMRLGWIWLIPISILNLLATGVVIMLQK